MSVVADSVPTRVGRFLCPCIFPKKTGNFAMTGCELIKLTFQWKCTHYDRITKKVGEFERTGNFGSEISCHMQIYPNGSSADNEDYLAVAVCVNEESLEKRKNIFLYYKIEIANAAGDEIVAADTDKPWEIPDFDTKSHKLELKKIIKHKKLLKEVGPKELVMTARISIYLPEVEADAHDEPTEEINANTKDTDDASRTETTENLEDETTEGKPAIEQNGEPPKADEE